MRKFSEKIIKTATLTNGYGAVAGDLIKTLNWMYEMGGDVTINVYDDRIEFCQDKPAQVRIGVLIDKDENT